MRGHSLPNLHSSRKEQEFVWEHRGAAQGDPSSPAASKSSLRLWWSEYFWHGQPKHHFVLALRISWALNCSIPKNQCKVDNPHGNHKQHKKTWKATQKKILLYIQAKEKNANELTIKQFLFSSFSITQTFQNSQVKFHNSIGMGCPSDMHSWERFSKA